MMDVTDKMKMATWILFERARSIEPAICVPGTRQFVSHLVNIFGAADFHEYDREILICKKIIDEAWDIYSEGQSGEAFKKCLPALDVLGHIAFDERFSTPVENIFSAPVGAS
jgi:hypothetical protein